MQPGCTTADGRKIFLSYSHEDRERASAVKMLLEVGGAQVFMDWRCVLPGIDWEAALEHALIDCDLLCVFWSAAALRSEWVRAEYTTFIRKFPDRRCVPLCADETPLPSVLARKQAPPEFLALANEFLALRRDLLARGVGQREQQRIVRDRLARLALPLDDAQRKKLLKLFASGISVGMLLTSLSKSFKAAGLIAAISVAFSLIWSPCSKERSGDPRLLSPRDDTSSRLAQSHRSRTVGQGPAAASEPTTDGPATSGGEILDESCCRPSSSSGAPIRIDAQTPAIAHTGRPSSTSGNSSRWNSPGWIKIGEKDVWSGSDHVHLDVRQRSTKYAELMLSVKDGDLEIIDFKLTFDNMEQLNVDTRRAFKDGSPEFVIELPVDTPIMTTIDLAYRKLPEGDHPHLEVWAKRRIAEATRPAVSRGMNQGERASPTGSAQTSTREPVSPATAAQASKAPEETRQPDAQISSGGIVSTTIRVSGDGTERVGPSPRAVDHEAGSAARAPAPDDMPAPDVSVDSQLASARNVVEGANAPQAIQTFVHGSGELIRADYAGVRRFTGGFRLFYTYYWKSNLSDLNNRTELSFDFDDTGALESCNIGRDSSLLPAFSEAQLVLELVKELLLDDRDVKQHPKLVRLIRGADAPQILVLILNLRMTSLAVPRR